jgi:hypothetical protein
VVSRPGSWALELLPGERVVLQGRPSWTVVGWPLVGCLVAQGSLAVLVVLAPSWPVVLWWGVLGVGLFLAGWSGVRLLLRSRAQVVLTTQRLLQREGLLVSRRTELALGVVAETQVRRSLGDWLLRRGTLVVRAGSGEELVLSALSRPRAWQAALEATRGALRSAPTWGVPVTAPAWSAARSWSAAGGSDLGEPTPPGGLPVRDPIGAAGPSAAGPSVTGPSAAGPDSRGPHPQGTDPEGTQWWERGPSGGRDVAARLRELRALYEEGLLSPEEFEAKRTALVAEL